MDLHALQFYAVHLKNYPRGVPRRKLRAPIQKVTFFYLGDMTADEKNLLMTAATQGLKFSPDNVNFEQNSSKQLSGAVISDQDTPADGFNGIWIKTLHPRAILESQSNKKQFWNDIKQITQ